MTLRERVAKAIFDADGGEEVLGKWPGKNDCWLVEYLISADAAIAELRAALPEPPE